MNKIAYKRIAADLEEAEIIKQYDMLRVEGLGAKVIISRGIELLAKFVKAGQQGKNFAIVDKDGTITELEFKL